MVLYYGREYHAASIGVRIVEVTCEECASEYFYELARVGKGSASAPYAIGSKGAARKSTDQAKENLDRRLAEEAELVPCPKCYWINEELVVGYRRGQCRGWTKFALGFGFFGTLISLVMAWLVATGPGADRGALPYLLYVGPGISIGVGVIVFLARIWFRSRIRPNQDFPHPPKLPAGCPKPLVKSPTTGELEPAPPMPGQETSGDEWLDFQIGRISIPLVCSGCLAPPDPKSAYQRPLDRAVVLVVPLCRSCAGRASWTNMKLALIFLVVGSAVVIPTLLIMKVDEIAFWFSVGLLCTAVPILGAFLGSWMTIPVRVKFVDSSRGIIRLWFRNEAYRKLIESSSARRS